MSELKAKYELGQVAYILQTSSINHFIYIQEVKIVGIEFMVNGLIEYKLTLGYFRREPDLVTTLEKAKEQCGKAIDAVHSKNREMLERAENINKFNA